MRAELIERFIYWIFFGLILAILPVLISFMISIIVEPKNYLFNDWIEAVSKGELFIICSALLGINLGDLSREAPSPWFKLFHFLLVAFSVILAMFTLAIFVFITNAKAGTVSHEAITNLSGFFLFMSTGICLLSLLVE